MKKEKHVHFSLSAENPREKIIIDILNELPNRQIKSFIVSLIEGQRELPQIAVEVHALANYFGVSSLKDEKDHTKPLETEHLSGQVSVFDNNREPQELEKEIELHIKPSAITHEARSKMNDATIQGKQAGDLTDMPDAVMGFMGNFNEGGDDLE